MIHSKNQYRLAGNSGQDVTEVRKLAGNSVDSVLKKPIRLPMFKCKVLQDENIEF